MTNNTIKSSRYYSLYEIVKEGLIPGADTYHRIKNIVVADNFTKGPLKAKRVARGLSGVQYKVLGSNIIAYLAMKDDQKK